MCVCVFVTKKSKFLVSGQGSVSDKRSLRLSGGEVECVSQFK